MGQKCTKCGQPAIVNIQKLWVRWGYDAKTDEYSSKCELLDIAPGESENLHLCGNCAQLWEREEI